MLNGPQETSTSNDLKAVLEKQGIKVDSIHVDYTLNISDPESAKKLAELYEKDSTGITHKEKEKLELSLSFDDSERDSNLGASDVEDEEDLDEEEEVEGDSDLEEGGEFEPKKKN